MLHLSSIDVSHDSDRNEFTASIDFCEPAPGMVITSALEAKGETLSEAIRNLAEVIEASEREGVLV